MPISTDQLRWLRFKGNGLLNPFDTASQAAASLCGFQSQEIPASMIAMYNRCRDCANVRNVEQMQFDDKSLVRIWAQRWTIHTFAREDWPLVQGALTGPHEAQDIGTEKFKVKEDTVDKLLLRAVAAGSKGITKLDVEDIVEDKEQLKNSRIFKTLVRSGNVSIGRRDGNVIQYVAREAWWMGGWSVPSSSDDANVVLFKRYLGSYGPASVQDFAYFRGVNLTYAKQWFDLIDPKELEKVEIDDNSAKSGKKSSNENQTLWVLKGSVVTEDMPTSAEGWPVRMLGKYDPMLLGLKDKFWLLRSPAHHGRIWTRNCIIEAVILVEGKISGVWWLQNEQKKKKGHLFSIIMFEEVEEHKSWLEPKIRDCVDKLAAFLNSEAFEVEIEWQQSKKKKTMSTDDDTSTSASSSTSQKRSTRSASAAAGASSSSSSSSNNKKKRSL